jgi:signal transduction protein with GAF and PtsI domain
MPEVADAAASTLHAGIASDASWSSINLAEAVPGVMTPLRASVDIDGMLSHSAVLARGLGIPCVMNTGRGTTTVHTGDVIRIDGAAGIVEILQRIGVGSR